MNENRTVQQDLVLIGCRVCETYTSIREVRILRFIPKCTSDKEHLWRVFSRIKLMGFLLNGLHLTPAKAPAN